MEFQLIFNVKGSMYQSITTVDETETPESIIDKLETGEYFTTINGDKKMIVETDTEKEIAYITNSDNELDFFGFKIV
jgi:hypothetical protein